MEGRICLIHKVRRNVGVEKCLDVAVNNGDVIQLMVGWRCMLISRSDSSLIHDFFLSITRDFCYKKFLLGDTLAEHRRVLSFHRQSMLLSVSFVVRPPLPVSSLNIRWLLVNAKVTVWLPALIFFFSFLWKQWHKHVWGKNQICQLLLLQAKWVQSSKYAQTSIFVYIPYIQHGYYCKMHSNIKKKHHALHFNEAILKKYWLQK